MVERIDVASLLTIDVSSELRKLTQAQLQGPWQLPAELVRRALRHGAQRVEIEIGRQQLRVRSRGGGVPLATLHELSVLLDAKRSPQRRHRALSALERAGALSLLGIVGLEPASVQIISPNANEEGETIGLSWRRGEGAALQRFAGTSRAADPAQTDPTFAEIIVRGAKLDRARAREWLQSVARYAPAEIIIDGRSLGQANRSLAGGFDDAFAVIPITAPVNGTLALPRDGELTRLYLLQDGLVTTHISVTEAPCFEAAIETRELAEASASAARLRDVIQPHIPSIVSAAIDHMIKLAQGSSLPTADRGRLTQLLLHSARRDREHAKAIAQVPLFRGIERDGRERWSDLLALRQSVHEDGGERLLSALFPDQDPSEFTIDGRVYILDESQRALLGELLELGFRQPRRRVEARRGLARLFREGPSLLRSRDWLLGLRPGGRQLPDAELEPEQRSLLVQLRAQVETCEVAMCTGSGPVRRIGATPDKLLLPRDSEQVRAAVRAVARDRAWVYPALLALLDGRAFPERARRRWSIYKL
ncbi:hypothetical protein DB30_04199 [Enhygromyxa salina]|uniref:Uncharacterized protein n=1 Tax=Enhygromyxa salina TaxID=215803 RepID=A0A0C2D0I7_9BACT|nr:hypothetical protein [Enhygromyxa salina]KIG16726.1 hypothetical protein DB30_04199 [Enhygromyxa salina]